jgi:SAM-dependent methyltransferase
VTTTTVSVGPIDETKLLAFLGKAVGDLGAAASSALVVIGDQLGLYREMAGTAAVTPAELAERTGTVERYVREWLVSQAAAGYIDYDPPTGRFSLSPEHALALADETSPFFVGGGYQLIAAAMKAHGRIAEVFRTGAGIAWGEYDPGLFEGTERFWRPGYVANLVASWIPALDGVEAKLRADLGCGHGASTIVMARAYPRSRFYGFDDHAPSIVRACQAATDAGVADRVVFEVASATEFPGRDYDLIAYFDCLHHLADPIGAMRHARNTLAPNGTVLIVEPMAGGHVEDNFNPIGVLYSATSVLVCTPTALATANGTAVGAMATDAQLAEVVHAAGLSRFRRATHTPFNRIFEGRP